jgi:hypothetical protein
MRIPLTSERDELMVIEDVMFRSCMTTPLLTCVAEYYAAMQT